MTTTWCLAHTYAYTLTRTLVYVCAPQAPSSGLTRGVHVGSTGEMSLFKKPSRMDLASSIGLCSSYAQPNRARVAGARGAGPTAPDLPILIHLAASRHFAPWPLRACTCHCDYGRRCLRVALGISCCPIQMRLSFVPFTNKIGRSVLFRFSFAFICDRHWHLTAHVRHEDGAL